MQFQRLLVGALLVFASGQVIFSYENNDLPNLLSQPSIRRSFSLFWADYPHSLLNETSSEIEAVSEDCKLDIRYAPSLASTKMYDASDKIPSGFLATSTHLGNWDECVSLRNIVRIDGQKPFHGQMCLWRVEVGHVEIAPLISDDDDNDVFVSSLPAKMAVCVPSSCSAADVENIFKSAVPGILAGTPYSDLILSVSVDPQDCTTRDPRPGFSAADWVAWIICLLLAAAVVASTAFDLLLPNRRPLLAAFSVYTNGKKLLTVSKGGDGAISCLHGIRFLSICWVILFHRFVANSNYPNMNSAATTDFIKDFTKIYVTNGNLAVDSFFLLGGILLSYTFFRQVPKMKSFNLPMFYIHRYIRLTPAFAVMILLYSTLVLHMGWGPLWQSKISGIHETCTKNWWNHLLYLGNYFASSNNCVTQSWYLMVDMQLYWLSPLVLIPLWKWPRFGLAFLLALCVGGTLSNFLITYNLGLSGFGLVKQDQFLKHYYKATYARFVPYLMGIALGYSFVEIRNRGVKVAFSRKVALGLWLSAALFMLDSLFTGYRFMNPPLPSDIAAAFHNAFHRVLWAMGLSLVILLCSTGHGGFINTFLSWPVFQVLGRLSYSMYLVHALIQDIQGASQRTTTFFDDVVLYPAFASDLLLSVLYGAALNLVAESPFLVLEKELLSGGNRRRAAQGSPDATAVPPLEATLQDGSTEEQIFSKVAVQ